MLKVTNDRLDEVIQAVAGLTPTCVTPTRGTPCVAPLGTVWRVCCAIFATAADRAWRRPRPGRTLPSDSRPAATKFRGDRVAGQAVPRHAKRCRARVTTILSVACAQVQGSRVRHRLGRNWQHCYWRPHASMSRTAFRHGVASSPTFPLARAVRDLDASRERRCTYASVQPCFLSRRPRSSGLGGLAEVPRLEVRLDNPCS